MARGRKPRTWVRLDCQGVLHGSINYIYTLEEKAVFITMIAMAEVYGPEPGLISDNDGRALPKEYLAHELHCSLEILDSVIEKGIKDESMESNGSGLRLLHYKKYQFTEYDRQKPYRDAKREREKEKVWVCGCGVSMKYHEGSDFKGICTECGETMELKDEA